MNVKRIMGLWLIGLPFVVHLSFSSACAISLLPTLIAFAACIATVLCLAVGFKLYYDSIHKN